LSNIKNMKDYLENLFIPHEGNDHTPHVLQERTIAALFLVVVTVFGLAAAQSYLVQNNAGMMAAVLPTALTELVNEERQANNLDTLTPDQTLNRAAQQKAQHMADNGYFAHFSPDGTSPWHWMRKAGYDYVYAGENLAVDFADSADVVRAWMDSRLHRENILEPKFTEVGFGIARGELDGQEAVFVVQMLARPLDNTQPTPPSTARADDTRTRTIAGLQDTRNESHLSSQTKDTEDTHEKKERSTTTTPTSADQTQSPKDSSTTVSTTRADTTNTTNVTERSTQTANQAHPQETPQLSAFAALITQPSAVIEGMYAILVTLIALAFAGVAVEYRRHHIRHMVYGLGLVAVMVVFVFLSHTLFLPVPTVG
jgi:uncharacterized protein YkwD